MDKIVILVYDSSFGAVCLAMITEFECDRQWMYCK